MTAAMRGIVRRMAGKVADCPERILLSSQPEHHAASIAWCARTGSARKASRWRGPGWYRLSGFRSDEGLDFATVEFDKPHPQGCLFKEM